MAGQHGYQTKCIRLAALLVFVCLAAGLVRRVTSPRSSISTSSRSNWSPHRDSELVQPNLNPDTNTLRSDRIHGRWEAVRASLGLPSLPHEVVFAPGPNLRSAGRSDKRASRFDLGRKRRAEEAARQLPRYITLSSQRDATTERR